MILRKIPTVIFPYWDCTMDNELGADSPKSHFFSEEFSGNGQGLVKTGPFAGWGFHRQAGQGDLVSRYDIAAVLSRTHHNEIVYPVIPGGKEVYVLEGHHSRIHVYVGGALSRLKTASKDPIFFLLHGFIDYVWWRFRNQQREMGIDSSKDYPVNTSGGHESSRRMVSVPEHYTNLAGYANNWTSEVYTYEESPTCPDCGNSTWLKCVNGFCRAKLLTEIKKEQRYRRDLTKKSYPSAGNNYLKVSPLNNYWGQNNDQCPKTNCQQSEPIQNDFEMNGQADTDNWGFVAARIIFQRPPGLKFNSFAVNNGVVQDEFDIYSENDTLNNQTNKQNNTGHFQESLGTFKTCKSSTSGNFKVYVHTDGVSYDGHSVEYAIVDERLPVSSSHVYVSVKQPTLAEDTVVLVTASDECGRLCHPMCLSNATSPPTYKPCSGILKLHASNSTHVVSKTITEEVQYIWKSSVEEGTCSPNKVCLQFMCDSVALYPWERLQQQ